MNKKIWLSSPHIGNFEQQFVDDVFKSNIVAPLGHNVEGFEKDLQHYIQINHAIALNAGTAAVHLSLILLGVKTDDIVICQSLTFSASANPILYQGATPVFVDSENDTWNMSPDYLEMAIRDCIAGKVNGRPTLPKAIVLVHLYGMPAKVEEIMGIANSYNIPIIEDAAEAIGSSVNKKKCGSFGKFGILSFNENNIITTSGGGALLSNDKEMIEKARLLATQDRDKAPNYQHSNIAYNYRLSNVLAAIGRGQMKALDKIVKKKRIIFNTYKKFFEEINKKGYNIEFQEEQTGNFSNRWLSCILVDPEKNKGIDPAKIRLELEENNIESRSILKPMHLQPIFSHAPYYGEKNAETLFNNGLCLPSDPKMNKTDFERIFDVLKKIFQ